ncbi:unnamed protein product, partial [Durusdinium trenchii]
MTEAKWAEVDNDPGLIFTLQSIQRNAPWARHIYVLQNPACESVWKRKLKRNLIPEASKTYWVDRCSLFAHPSSEKKGRSSFKKETSRETAILQQLDETFPELGLYHQGSFQSLLEHSRPSREGRQKMRKQKQMEMVTSSEGPVCPTRSLYAVQTVLHHIPGLAPRFILVNPGDIALKPLSVKNFFYQMKPRYPAVQAQEVYKNQTSIAQRLSAALGGTSLPRSSVSRERRVWVPLTTRLCARLEERYPGWMSFVRSHRWGKYSSLLNSFGTPASEQEDSQEESLQGVWWWYLMSHPHSGMRHHGKLFEERRLSSDLAQWEVLLSDPTVAVVTLHGASDPLQEEVPLRRQLRHRVRDLIAMQISVDGSTQESQEDVEDEDQEEGHEKKDLEQDTCHLPPACCLRHPALRDRIACHAARLLEQGCELQFHVRQHEVLAKP